MNKASVTSPLTYCAADYYKKNFISGSVVLLLCIGVVMFAVGKSNAIQRAIPIICIFVLFLLLYGSFCLKAKKKFSVAVLSEKGIVIKCPSGQQFEIPWDDQISAASFYAEMNVSLSGGSHYELILSSSPLPYHYKVDHIELFSEEQYQNSGKWRLSLGRGTKKWCEREANKIMALKENAGDG